MASTTYSNNQINKDVLIVDDNKNDRELFQRLLKEIDYSFESARSGEDALYLLRVLRKKYKLILLDINLPGGMHGVDVCLEIRKDDKKIPIYAISGLSPLFQLADVRVAGFNGYFEKPIIKDDLIRLLKKVIGGGKDGKGPENNNA